MCRNSSIMDLDFLSTSSSDKTVLSGIRITGSDLTVNTTFTEHMITLAVISGSKCPYSSSHHFFLQIDSNMSVYFGLIFFFPTRIPDSAALQLSFVLCDTWSSGLSSFPLTVSTRLLWGLGLQQLLGASSSDEWTGPWWWGGNQLLLTALSPCASTETKTKNISVSCQLNYSPHSPSK